MDRTAPTFLPLDLNHVLGTAAAPMSVDVRSADQISADKRMLSVGRKGCDAVKTLRRCGAHPFIVEKIRRRSPARRSGPFCDLFRDPPLWLKKLGKTGPCAQ
jgi:hypothetical protein